MHTLLSHIFGADGLQHVPWPFQSLHHECVLRSRMEDFCYVSCTDRTSAFPSSCSTEEQLCAAYFTHTETLLKQIPSCRRIVEIQCSRCRGRSAIRMWQFQPSLIMWTRPPTGVPDHPSNKSLFHPRTTAACHTCSFCSPSSFSLSKPPSFLSVLVVVAGNMVEKQRYISYMLGSVRIAPSIPLQSPSPRPHCD
ncbi:hypothetical protein BC628DRAFT_138035 [Trametes gibbosa]|nr:hypothetical protein BC628DRAFT_138035 [Trametes gibbosa]